MARRVVRLRLPGPPAGCRERPSPRDPIEAVSRYHEWLEERDLRAAQHLNLDEALAGVIPPGGRAAVTPSSLMYDGRLPQVALQWDQRWWTARLVELSHFAIAELLSRLDAGLACRRDGLSPATLLARAIGWRVHSVIQQRYRRARAGNRVSLDNRIHTVAGSERLAVLARREPRSDYGALSFALAGTRADIIDLTTREMWEIKPAALAATAVLQLWAYLDNYEVARVFNGLVEDGVSTAPIDAGAPRSLPPEVTEPISLRIRGVPVPLVVNPYTVDRLPGLILYTVGVDNGRRGRPAAAQAIALGRDQMNQLLLAAGRDERQRREAAIAAAEAGQQVATATLVVCAATLLVAGAVVLAPGAAAGGGVAVTESVGGTVVNLAARRAVLSAATREGVREVAKRAAGVVIVSAAGSRFEAPPEIAGHSIDVGLQAGLATSAEARSLR